MSIRSEIALRCKEGRLHEFPDPWGVGRHPRHLFVSPMVHTILQPSAWDGSPESKCYVAANARFEAYARNDEIPFAWNPDRKPPFTAFARVKPINLSVVAVRARHRERNQIRLFGCFAEKDWFIVLRWDFRTGIDFTKEAKCCRKDWAALFSHPPLKGNSVHDYISDNVTSV